jgi:small subunit ribosomal protein S27Ae
MAKEEKKKAPGKSKKDYYTIKGDTLERQKKSCPKCGPGVFLAEHGDRTSCGTCGYTEFRKK